MRNFSSEKKYSHPLAQDPAIASIVHRRTKPEPEYQDVINDEESSMDELPPGMQPESGFVVQSSPPTTRRVLTMDEIEARLEKSRVSDEPSHIEGTTGSWLPPRSTRPPIISFPTPLPYNSSPAYGTRLGRSSESDDLLARHTGFMTRYERENVARIHRTQLATENPAMEDYYYRAYVRRRHETATSPTAEMMSMRGMVLDLASITTASPRRIQHQSRARREARSAAAAKIKEIFSTALGKKTSTSFKAPRTQLSVPVVEKAIHERDHEHLDKQINRWSASLATERIYEEVIAIEQQLDESSPSEKDPQAIAALRQHAMNTINEILLNQSVSQTEPEEGETRFLTLLSLPKAMLIVGRALRVLDHQYGAMVAEGLLERLVELYEYLSVCRVDVAEQDVDLFVNSVLAPLVPWVARASSTRILPLLERMVGKKSVSWLACMRPGIILFCILLSRLEILKRRSEAEDEALGESEDQSKDNNGGGDDKLDRMNQGEQIKLNLLIENLFDALQDRIGDVFSRLEGADAEFYGWQFLALLSLNIDADRKRILVTELRERILDVASHPEKTQSIKNLNIFLNTLGLDASQLVVSQM